MLYYLFRFLEEYGISGSHMWGYISFRALLALIFSLVISAWFGEKFIKYLKSKQITETQRDASIDPFGTKKIGVPSMGGIIIIVSILIPVLLLGRLLKAEHLYEPRICLFSTSMCPYGAISFCLCQHFRSLCLLALSVHSCFLTPTGRYL